MRELQFIRSGRLEWREREPPSLLAPTDAIVRPFVAGRCDGDTLPIHRPVSRALQVGMHVGLVDPIVGSICGHVPFRGPFGIGHECVAQIVRLGDEVTGLTVGQTVVVPWAVSCGTCLECSRGLTAKFGYYLAPGTKVPLMQMYANDATLRIGVSHVRPILPTLLDFVAREDFPAELVTTITADWEDAPTACAEHTTKLVLRRDPLPGPPGRA